MTKFCTNRNKQTILIESIPYSNWEIEMVRMNIPADNRSFRQELFSFLSEWFDPADTLPVHTSGSTGKPKELYVEKERMMESACLTCSFLGLQKEDSALLCMPLQYIAGKMVVIRALVAGLDLLPVTPSGHPLKDLTKAPVFAAMIPMQVYNSLQVPEEKAILQQIRHLIIGGGPIDSQLNAALKDFPHAVWSTYGMTETLSHIALRRLNGPEASDWYTPFESIQIRLSKENTLVIYAPEICEKELVTNDIAEINGQNQFRILGRKDNTINTGGVKVQIEQVEAALKEQRIDEAYLQNWEAQLKAQAAEKHGTGEAGCDSEKKARGETANSPEARIADFRAKIADRKAETGKEYLSFYFMEANSYEVE